FEGLKHTWGSHRIFGHTNSCGIKERIRDSPRSCRHDFLASPGRGLVKKLDNDGRDFWALIEAQNRIGLPIEAGPPGRTEFDLFFQKAAGCLNQLSTNLFSTKAGFTCGSPKMHLELRPTFPHR